MHQPRRRKPSLSRRREVAGKSFELLEPRRMLASAVASTAASTVASVYRPINEVGNNLQHPTWGAVGDTEVRVAPAAYTDGIAQPPGANRPSARELSDSMLAQHQGEDIFNQEGMSAFVYAWGQFIDHDMDLTSDAVPAEPFNIPVPYGDGYFDPNSTGTQVIGLNRSEYVGGVNSPRQQPNDITGFLDGSMVYGSDLARSNALRTFQNGMLKSSDNGMQLPYNTMGLPNDTAGFPGDDPTNYFAAGDRRANENAELTSLQVLFMREHNRLAASIQSKHKNWNDERVFQTAREIVIGEIQRITYTEFLPSFLGNNPLPAYKGYNPKVDPEISTEFATAAFRFGHSILGDDVQFFDDDANTTLDDLKLDETFFAPNEQLNGGTDGLLKYLAAVSAQEDDLIVVQSIRNFLFGPPGSGGFDLASLDIQRGRDHGLADYNTERAAVGLPKITSFAQMTSNVSLQAALQVQYGSVDNVDLFVGAMAEDHAPGAAIGPTFQRIIEDQFRRTRDGDRFWYQRSLPADELAYVNNTTLGDIIKRNTTLTNVQKNVFQFDVQITGQVWNDVNGNGKKDAGEKPLAFQNVQLYTDDGDAVASLLTDANGKYDFTALQVGGYVVQLDLNDGWQQTTAPPDVMVVNTDIQFHNRNFGERLAPDPMGPPPVKSPIVPPIIGNGATVKSSPIDDLIDSAV